MDTSWINNYPYLVAFLTGLFGGVHCVGMCGGIVGMLSFSQQPHVKKTSFLQQLPVLLGYNMGRIIGYVTAGAIVAILGASLIDLTGLDQTKRVLSLIAAFFMLLLGLYLAGLWNALSKVESIGAHLWKYIEPLSRRFIPVNTVQRAIPLGFLWGWLPCGLVYTVLIMALTAGGAVEGALLMLAFGLGTLPNLLAMGMIAARLTKWTHKPNVRLFAGLLVIAMGMVTLLRVF